MKLDYEMGQATGIMRKIRQDRVTEEDSFEIVKSQSGESLEEVVGISDRGFESALLISWERNRADEYYAGIQTERTREIGSEKP